MYTRFYFYIFIWLCGHYILIVDVSTHTHKPLFKMYHSFWRYLCIIIVLDLLIFISTFLNFCLVAGCCDALLSWLRHGVQSKAVRGSWVFNKHLLNVWYVSSTVLHIDRRSIQSWYNLMEKITIKQWLIYNVLSALWVLQVMRE